MLPEEVDLLALQPVGHRLVHVVPSLVVGVGQVVQDLVAQAVLSNAEELVSFSVLVQLLF